MLPGHIVFEELNQDSPCRTYLLASRRTGEAVIVDPLLDRVPGYLARLAQERLVLSLVVDTHTHADHLSGARELSRLSGARIAGAPAQAVHWPLHGGETLALDDLQIEVWASPGHTADALVLRLPDRVLTGDTLLIGTTGRTDLPSGDAAAEWDSLQRLLRLPDDTAVYPAHDYAGRTESTIGEERRTNRRLNIPRDEFLALMNAPRNSRPKLLDIALAYNARPLEERHEAASTQP